MAEKSKGGRPPHKPTPALRNRVAIAAGGGMPHEEIALAIGLTPPTLRKHYAKELSTVAHQRRLQVLEAVFDAAVSGKIAAQRLYLSTTPDAAAPDLEPDSAPDGKPRGKKAQAAADAVTAHAGTDWEELLNRPGAPRVQ